MSPAGHSIPALPADTLPPLLPPADKNKDDPEAEKKFQEVARAYEVRSRGFHVAMCCVVLFGGVRCEVWGVCVG